MGHRVGLTLLLLGLGVLAMGDQAWKKEPLVWEMGHLFKLEELGRPEGPPQRPPSFMLDLFQRVADSNGITKDPEVLRGNMVRCFQEKVHINQSHFFFNLSSVGQHEKVLRASLHVFKLRNLHRPPSHDQGQHFHRVEVHEVLGATPESARGKLLSARELPLTSHGWLVFDVTSTVASWVQRATSARSFLVLTKKTMGKPLNYSYGGVDRKWDPSENRNSLLVVYTNNRDQEPPRKDVQTTLPTALWLPPEETCPPTQQPPSSGTISHCRLRRSARSLSPKPAVCQKHQLYVNFRTIGWNSWVISPAGYQVNFCKGGCVYPLGHRTNASNHASFMSFLSFFNVHDNISSPSCVPIKLSSINLLYYDEQKTVVLRQYADMTVDTCGCH